MTQALKISSEMVVSLIVVIVAGLFFAGAIQMRGIGGTFPQYVSGAVLALALIDLALVAAGRFRGRPSDIKPVRLSREIEALAWPFVLLALVYVFGFYLAIPLFLAGFFAVKRSLGLKASIAVILGFSFFMYVCFILLLRTPLYAGILGISF